MKRLLLIVLFFVGLVWALAAFPGLANQGNYDSIILNFRDDMDQTQIEQRLQALSQQFGLTPQANSAFSQTEQVYVLEGDRATLKALRKSDLKQDTEAIEPNYIYQAFGTPDDPDYSKQWNFRSINVEGAWAETKGKGITVAVIDTGISRVQDLENTTFVKGYDFVNDREDASDDNGHGTHVAGTIAQSTNNRYGVTGIAYEASLMPLKVLAGSGGGTVSDIADAIRFAADHGADVINMSLGGGGDTTLMREAIEYAYRKGVVIVAAAGNANTNAAAYPARYEHVIAVAAVDSSGEKAPYSNYGAGVNISAPGGSTINGDAGGILQHTINPGTGEGIFRAFQGTSMAAPHVAGVAALIKASGVSNPDDVAATLYQSARKVEADELNHFGAGYLDASAAVQLANKGKLSFQDFFRWLRNSGYLNPRFWFDGGVVNLVPKVLMVLGSYLLAWFLRNYLPFFWNWFFTGGLVIGSAGLFLLKGLYIFDAPQWPLRILGSSIPELGTAVQANGLLNPITASVLIPLALIAVLLSNPTWKWFAIGSALGTASCLVISAILDPSLAWIGSGAIARGFLVTNALLCFLLAYLALKTEAESA